MKKLLPYLFVATAWYGTAQNSIQTYIPDDNFEQALIDLGYDDVLDDYVLTENIETITSLLIARKNIKDISGLEDFISLEVLDISQNEIQSIDPSIFTKLRVLHVSQNYNLAQLDVSKNTELEILGIGDTKIDEIDLSQNSNLVEFEAYFNTLNQLDVSSNTLLQRLLISYGTISALNLSQNPDLITLELNFNDRLNCIQVANVDEALAQPSWFKDDTASYSENCTSTPTGKITVIQEITDDAGTYYFHNIENNANFDWTIGSPGTYVRTSVDEPVKDPASTPFLKESNFLAQVEGEGIESVKFTFIAMPWHEPFPVFGETTTFIDNEPPYTAYGDDNDSFATLRFKEFAYILTATPYTSDNAEGDELEGATVNFVLHDYHYQFDSELHIINAEDDTILQVVNLDESPSIDLGIFKNKRIKFEVFEGTGNPSQAIFRLRKDGELLVNQSSVFRPYVTTVAEDFVFEEGMYTLAAIPDGFQNPVLRFELTNSWTFTITDSNDVDGDGIQNEIDLCPDTPTGESVNAFGCSVSQLADLAVQNIGLSIGSDPCVESSGFAEISVLQNVPLDVEIFKDGASFYTGSITLATPLDLTDLAFGAYEICVSNDTALGYEQCFDVSYSALSNSVSTNIIIQNPGQTYTMQVAGSTSYTLLVNGVATDFVFDSTETQEIEIPLAVGTNVISIIGNLDCSNNLSGKIEAIQEITNDNGNYYFHNLDKVFPDNFYLRDDLENRMPSEVPFLKESNFLAVTSGDDIESVKFTIRETSLGRLMNFNETITYIDNEAPYTAFGDENELFESKLLIEHNYRITTEAYSEDDANGALLASKQVYVSLYDFGVKFGLDLQIIDSDTKELLQEINLNEHPVISAEIFKDRNLTYLVSDGTTTYDSVISGGFLSLDDETGNIATGYQWFTELKTSSDFSFQNGTYKVSVVPDVVHNFLKRPVFTNIWKFNIIDADKVSDTLGDKMIVFPTITKGLITIDNSDREDIATVSVMAINGKRIVQKPINDAPAQIKLDISGHIKGMYLVQLVKKSGKDELIKVMLK